MNDKPKRKKSEPWSNAGLKRRWRQRQKAHPFGLFTPVQEGPEATQQLQAKLQRIADHIDQNLSPDAVERLRKVLRMCEGFQTRAKRGHQDRAQVKWKTTCRHLVLMARLTEYNNFPDKDGDYSDVDNLEQIQINRMIERQPELWEAMHDEDEGEKLCRAIIRADNGTPPPNLTKEQLEIWHRETTPMTEEQLEQWFEEHPNILRDLPE